MTGLDRIRPDIEVLYRDLHAHPELGHAEHRTAGIAAERLRDAGYAVTEGIGTTGVVGVLANGDGADVMVDAGLTDIVPRPDVALAQHVLPYPAGYVGVREGSVLSAADSFRITLFGRGGHGSMPQATEDPVVLAAMCVIRLQTIVSREIAATTPAVVTVGKIAAGTGPTIIPDTATVELNVRTYDEQTRTRVLDAIRRCVDAKAVASGSPRAPLIERLTEFPPTVNDPEVVRRLRSAFAARFGDDLHTLDLQTASEDFSRIPDAWGTPYAYWGVGGTDPAAYAEAEERGTVAQDIPVNHSPGFAPVIQPTLDAAVTTLVTAALEWLGSADDR